jgi:hypothetical protein
MKKLSLVLLALLIAVPLYAADSKLTALTADTAPASTDIVYFVKDPGGSPLSRKITLGNLSKALACYPTEIDAHTAASPTAAQLASCNATSIHNYNQEAADVDITLPAAAANLGFLATVSTAQAANYWRFTAASAGTMYLNGSTTGKNYVQYATPVAGYYFSCFTANLANAYVWYCADGVGALTTN